MTDWGLFLTVIGTAVAMIGFIYQIMRNFKSDIGGRIDKLDSDILSIRKDWKEESAKMDQRIIESNKRMDGVYHILLKRTEQTK